MSKRSGLGRGLSALMGESYQEMAAEITQGEHQHLPLDGLIAGIYQPRKMFFEEELNELAESIRKNGVLQPIIVRKLEDGNYQIIAGERRWRASKIAGKTTIPALVKELTDQEALEFAIIENIQRQDLNPLEEAEAYFRLMQEFSHTQEALAVSLGKSRSHIANMLRILSLPDEIKQHIYDGKLTAGHARSLINAENAVELAEKIINEKLSVRQSEALTRPVTAEPKAPKKAAARAAAPISAQNTNEDMAALEASLTESLGMRVRIEESAEGGKVTVFFNNVQQLDNILQRLGGAL